MAAKRALPGAAVVAPADIPDVSLAATDCVAFFRSWAWGDKETSSKPSSSSCCCCCSAVGCVAESSLEGLENISEAAEDSREAVANGDPPLIGASTTNEEVVVGASARSSVVPLELVVVAATAGVGPGVAENICAASAGLFSNTTAVAEGAEANVSAALAGALCALAFGTAAGAAGAVADEEVPAPAVSLDVFCGDEDANICAASAAPPAPNGLPPLLGAAAETNGDPPLTGAAAETNGLPPLTGAAAGTNGDPPLMGAAAGRGGDENVGATAVRPVTNALAAPPLYGGACVAAGRGAKDEVAAGVVEPEPFSGDGVENMPLEAGGGTGVPVPCVCCCVCCC